MRRLAVFLAAIFLVPLGGAACSLAIPFSDYDAEATSPPGTDAGASDAMSAYDGPTYVDTLAVDGPLVHLRLDDAHGPAPTIRGHVIEGAAYGSGVTYSVPGALVHESDTAIAVDGTSYAVDLTDDAVFSFPGAAPYTFEIWVLPSGAAVKADTTAYHAFWTRNQGAVDGGPARVAYAAGLIGELVYSIRIIDGDDPADDNYPTAGTEANAWLHVAVTFDGSNNLLYLDGALVETATSADDLDFAEAVDLLVGGQETDSSGDQRTFFIGAMDEFAVYDHALTADRIACHHAVGAGTPLPAGCGS